MSPNMYRCVITKEFMIQNYPIIFIESSIYKLKFSILRASKSAKDHWDSFKDGKAQASCIIRNSKGSIVLASSQPHNCIDPLAAETLALLYACKLLDRLKIEEAILEADSLNAISAINNASLISFWTTDPLVDKIKKYWKVRIGGVRLDGGR